MCTDTDCFACFFFFTINTVVHVTITGPSHCPKYWVCQKESILGHRFSGQNWKYFKAGNFETKNFFSLLFFWSFFHSIQCRKNGTSHPGQPTHVPFQSLIAQPTYLAKIGTSLMDVPLNYSPQFQFEQCPNFLEIVIDKIPISILKQLLNFLILFYDFLILLLNFFVLDSYFFQN